MDKIKKTAAGLAVLLLLWFAGEWVAQYWKQKDLVRYQVYVSSFYEAVHDFTDTYFTDENGDLIIHFGGHSDGIGLGHGAQSAPDDYFPLPTTLHIRWFNPLDNQFWQGKFAMPKERLTELFKQCDFVSLAVPNMDFSCPFNSFVINATPSGQVFVYVSGAQTVFIGQYQAHQTDTDWERFYRGIGGYPEMVSHIDTRLQYIADVKKYFFEDEHGIFKESIEALKESPPPTDPTYWNRFFKTYTWRLAVNSPNTLLDYDANYVNGEWLTTYQGENGPDRQAPVPYRVVFFVKKSDGIPSSYVVEFDQKTIMAAFEKIGAYGKPIIFQADFDKTYDNMDSYLTAVGVDEKIMLEPTRLELRD